MKNIFENVQNKLWLNGLNVRGNWSLKGCQSLLIFLLAVSISASPVLAEAPAENPTLDDQTLNTLDTYSHVRRLLLINECNGCDLTDANLRDADLTGADLRNAILRGADLSGSRLRLANLEAADLTGANLSNALLIKTNLSNTRLDWVNFSGARLYTVNVIGASISNLNLTGAQLRDTAISVGGDERSFGPPHEPTVPFEETLPPIVESDPLLTSPR